jgi:DNA-directed RNA polymerase subunit M/transcription elongation factor TFIIS
MEELRQKSIDEFQQFQQKIDSSSIKLLEEGIYDYSIERLDSLGYQDHEELPIDQLKFIYCQNFTKVILSLNDENTHDILLKNPYKFVELKRQELNSTRWEKLYRNRTDDIARKKGAHRCPKCKSWFTEYIEVQTRSADESATIKISCECGYRWKLN